MAFNLIANTLHKTLQFSHDYKIYKNLPPVWKVDSTDKRPERNSAVTLFKRTEIEMQAARRDSGPVHDHDVPVMIESVGLPQPGSPRNAQPERAEHQHQEHMVVDDVDGITELDPVIRHLLPFIDGYSHVSKIATNARMEKTLAKSCIEYLVTRGVVALIPLLNIRNTYYSSSNFNRLLDDRELQEACLKFIANSSDSKQKPLMTDVFEVLSCLQLGASLWTVFDRHAESNAHNFDIRRLVVFAQLHDILKCHKRASVAAGGEAGGLMLSSRINIRPIYDDDIPVFAASMGLLPPGQSQRTAPPEDAEHDLERPDDRKRFKSDRNADLDPTTKQLLPLINGYNHVLKIAAAMNVEKAVVKSCIQNLVFSNVVIMIPAVRYINPYRATPSFNRLLYEHELQNYCLAFITKVPNSLAQPSLKDVLEVLSTLQQSNNLRVVCNKYANASALNFDILRLVSFALLHGLIHCVNIYPVYTPNPVRLNGLATQCDSVMGIRKFFNGRLTTDEICCIARIDHLTLQQIIENDPNVTIRLR